MEKNSLIFVANSGDIVGKRLLSMLRSCGYSNLLNDKNPNLVISDAAELNEFFGDVRPEYIFVTAGKSGGIQVNNEKPADLMLDNLQIACNVIKSSYTYGAKRLLYLASSCVYPRMAMQPMKPEMLMTGYLEQTNASYATAKLAGIELCRAYQQQHKVCYFSAIPANVFGPGDDFSEQESHVIGGLIRKIHWAYVSDQTAVEIWGSGEPERDFIYVDDLADACLFLMGNYDGDGPINIGTGRVVSIAELAELINSTIGYKGRLDFNTEKPDGMPRKLLDSSALYELGWQSQMKLEDGIRLTYEWYLKELTHGE